MNNTILCVKWGDKYDRTYVEKLKNQCDNNCSLPFNFYCLTDNPTELYDIQLPTSWDRYYLKDRNFFSAIVSPRNRNNINRNFLFKNIQ